MFFWISEQGSYLSRELGQDKDELHAKAAITISAAAGWFYFILDLLFAVRLHKVDKFDLKDIQNIKSVQGN